MVQVNGEERKRSSENYDKLMEKATKCLRRIFELAPTKKRNYILDQVNYKFLVRLHGECNILV